MISNLIKKEIKKERDSLRGRSTPAICGTFEREIIVPKQDVAKWKKKIINAGNFIVGTGEAGFGKTKIWFNPVGANL